MLKNYKIGDLVKVKTIPGSLKKGVPIISAFQDGGSEYVVLRVFPGYYETVLTTSPFISLVEAEEKK